MHACMYAYIIPMHEALYYLLDHCSRLDPLLSLDYMYVFSMYACIL